MKLATVVGAAALLLGGCAAPVGQTSVNLHQDAVFDDGTRVSVAEFKVSEQVSNLSHGPAKVPGQVVTVSVEISNAGKAINAADVQLDFRYTDDRNTEVAPPQVGGSRNAVLPGTSGRVSKDFRVGSPSVLFRSGHLRVEVQAPTYPSVTFSGQVP
ncbi:MAG TPA: hypothetical protein VFP89_04215 [Propionibacteriaceae bacterium]|nr:hypothetical protein [Propionibacteriaceae bacterium]